MSKEVHLRKFKCVSCKREARVRILYPFCEACFLKHYERRVETVMRRYRLIEPQDKVLVAVSGGKDSLSCAHFLNRYREKVDFDVAVLHIDVGIVECTNERTERVVRSFCEQRGIEFYHLTFEDYLGVNPEILFRKSRRPQCSLCGMLKRYIMNRFARERGFNKVATGHCCDDIVRFFFKNWISRNFTWIMKLRPITESNHPKVITRIRPLFESLELENYTYAMINNINVAGCSRCSFFLRKDKWYDILRMIEKRDPYFKLNFVRGLHKIKWYNTDDQRVLNECIRCGEPTDKEICSVCVTKEVLNR